MDKEKKELIQNMYPELKGKDFDKFIYLADQTSLDPLRNQIYSVKRNTKSGNGWVASYTVQTSIDGFRLIAERTGKYAPGKEPLIILDENKNIVSSTAYVKKMTADGTWHEVASTAYYEEYVQTDKEGKPTRFWKQMPKLMISKCAEALALRKAFPDALSGLYTDDEMDQADIKEEKEDPRTQLIDEQQTKEIKELLKKLPPAFEKQFLKDCQADEVSKITKAKFTGCVAYLNQRITEGAKK